MFRSEVIIDANSYVELVGRKSGQDDLLALTLRGSPSSGLTTLASVSLTKEEVETIIKQMQDWLASPK